MPDLIIKNDYLTIEFDVQDIESKHLPSFMVKLSSVIKHPTGTFNYSANDIWFENLAFDDFMLNISKVIKSFPTSSAIIQSMSKEFVFKVTKDKWEISINEYFQFDNDSTCIDLKINIPVNVENNTELLNSFNKFSKWW